MKYDFEMDLDEQSSVGKIAAQIKPRSKVLEFGPGNGRLTKHLIGAKQCEVSIVELDKELFDFVNEFAKDGFYGDIESFEWENYFSNQKFDYILFADVLEHLVAPVDTLKKAKRFLNDNGEILITFPNLAHNSVLIGLFNNQLPWNSYGLLDETHNSFFTHDGFEKVFNEAGLFINIEDYLYLAVEDTELPFRYEELPVAVRYDFKMRPYGEVYQYFFSLKRQEPIKKNFAQPTNSNYVEAFEFVQLSNKGEINQQISINSHTGENQVITLPIDADVKKVFFRFKKQPSFIEFQVEISGNKLEHIHSNAVFKTENDCYLFDGQITPEFSLIDVERQIITLKIHYRFWGELTQTFSEALETFQSLADVQKRIADLEEENTHFRKTNATLNDRLQTTLNRYSTLINSKEWIVKPRKIYRLKKISKKNPDKKIALCIDERHWNKTTQILTIRGWGISRKDRKPLSYQLSLEQSPFFDVKKIYRKEVNEAENLADTSRVGFELQIFCEQERSFLIEVTAEDGQHWIVEM